MAQEYQRLPSWLKPPLESGYSMEVIDRRQKTQMEIGSLYRVEFDTDEASISFEFACNPIQAAYLESFEKNLLNQGSTWFIMPLYYSGGMRDTKVRFADRPKLSRKEGIYSYYQIVLDVQQREELMCAETLLMLDCFEPCQITKMSKALNDFMTQTLAGSTALPAL